MTRPRIILNTVPLKRHLLGRVKFGLFLLAAIALAGVVGYKLLDQGTWVDALYATVSVLTTLGLPEMPRTQAKELFTVLLAVGGIGLFLYAIGGAAQLYFAGEFHRALARRKVLHQMEKLSQHFIVCGYGRVGEIIVRHMREQNLPFVVVERDPAVFQRVEEEGCLAHLGDATHDEVLHLSGLDRARAVIAVTSTDGENLLLTMTARQLNPGVPIIVRCDEESNTSKFIRAGATRVVMPDATGAHQMLLAATKPHVIDLFDLAIGTGPQSVQVRELPVPAASPADGRSLKDLQLGSRFGIIVIGIKSKGQELVFNPSANATLHTDDVLITVGREDQFRELETFLGHAA